MRTAPTPGRGSLKGAMTPILYEPAFARVSTRTSRLLRSAKRPSRPCGDPSFQYNGTRESTLFWHDVDGRGSSDIWTREKNATWESLESAERITTHAEVPVTTGSKPTRLARQTPRDTQGSSPTPNSPWTAGTRHPSCSHQNGQGTTKRESSPGPSPSRPCGNHASCAM